MPRFALIISLTALSCSEQKFHAIEGADGVRGPAIQVDPAFLEFGLHSEAEESVKTFMVASVGEEALEVENDSRGSGSTKLYNAHRYRWSFASRW